MLTPQNTEAIRRIEEAIGYTFHDKRLLVQVLTRKTYLKIDPEAPDNEVLEFYGDTLMNYHVTNYFMSKYAHMLDDGLFFMRTVEQFTDMRSHYVCNRYLTDRVKALGLARYLRAQNRDAELRRDGEKAYADIFESLVGAIYLDSYQNDTLIRAFILRQLGIEPKRPPEEIEAFDYDSLTNDPTVALEEPDAAVDLPAEEPTAEVIASVEEVVAKAAVAEQAVEESLPVEEVMAVAPSLPDAPTAEETSLPAEPLVTPAPIQEAVVEPVEEPIAVPMPMQEALAAFCEQMGFDQPTYGQTPPNAPNARPVAACTMKYKDTKGKLVKISLNDSGKTLAEATEKAAAKMLKKLERQVAETAKSEKIEKVEKVAEKSEKPSKKSRDSLPVMPVEEMLTPVPAEATVEAADVDAEQLVIDVEEPAIDALPEAPAKETPPVTEGEIETTAAPEAIAESDLPAMPEEVPAPEAAETVAEADAETRETAPVETPIQEVAEEAPVEGSEAVETTPVEVPSAEAAKPAKAPRKRKTEGEKSTGKTSSKRKKAADAVADTAEISAESAESASLPAEEAETAPIQEVKPRARKPRTKKPAEVAESAETVESVESVESADPAAVATEVTEVVGSVELPVVAIEEVTEAPAAEEQTVTE